jgi:uncharacterized protein YeaO (DUF488 family)
MNCFHFSLNFAFKFHLRRYTVVWHQSLLCFVQRYKHEIRAEDKTRLRKLVDTQHHYQIGPEAGADTRPLLSST